MGLMLDRMAVDDVGANPVRIAAAIHEQLGEGSGPVPVFEIARALDIIEVRTEPLTNFEGGLVTTSERGFGSILVNGHSSRKRRRFTGSHELMHFLSPIHRPTFPEGFWCSRRDMTENELNSTSLHRRQEAEANCFAIELLAPRSRIKKHLRGDPDLASVVSMGTDLDISKEAAARRYVECHGETLAVVFSHHGRLLYWGKSRDFPVLAIRQADPLPELPENADSSGLSAVEEVMADEWIERAEGKVMLAQTLYQQKGYAMTLLYVVSTRDDETGGIDDTYERFGSLGRS